MRRCISFSMTGGHTLREAQRAEKSSLKSRFNPRPGTYKKQIPSSHTRQLSDRYDWHICGPEIHSTKQQAAQVPLQVFYTHVMQAAAENRAVLHLWSTPFVQGAFLSGFMQVFHLFVGCCLGSNLQLSAGRQTLASTPTCHHLPVGDRTPAAAACCGDAVGLAVQGCPASADL